MQQLCTTFERFPDFSGFAGTFQAQVRFIALYRIEPHAPLVVRLPANSFEFRPCGYTPQAIRLTRLLTSPPINREELTDNVYG